MPLLKKGSYGNELTHTMSHYCCALVEEDDYC